MRRFLKGFIKKSFFLLLIFFPLFVQGATQALRYGDIVNINNKSRNRYVSADSNLSLVQTKKVTAGILEEFILIHPKSINYRGALRFNEPVSLKTSHGTYLYPKDEMSKTGEIEQSKKLSGFILVNPSNIGSRSQIRSGNEIAIQTQTGRKWSASGYLSYGRYWRIRFQDHIKSSEKFSIQFVKREKLAVVPKPTPIVPIVPVVPVVPVVPEKAPPIIGFSLIKGGLVQISRNGEHLWGVNSVGSIYQWTGSTWAMKSGKLVQVSVGSDGEVWGVNRSKIIYRWDGTSWQPNRLRTAKKIAVGNKNNIWIIGLDDKPYKWSGSTWIVQRGGNLKDISVGADGAVWGVTRANVPLRWDLAINSWKATTGKLRQISCGSRNMVAGIDPTAFFGLWVAGKPLATGSPFNPDWKRIGGDIRYVSVDQTGKAAILAGAIGGGYKIYLGRLSIGVPLLPVPVPVLETRLIPVDEITKAEYQVETAGYKTKIDVTVKAKELFEKGEKIFANQTLFALPAGTKGELLTVAYNVGIEKGRVAFLDQKLGDKNQGPFIQKLAIEVDKIISAYYGIKSYDYIAGPAVTAKVKELFDKGEKVLPRPVLFTGITLPIGKRHLKVVYEKAGKKLTVFLSEEDDKKGISPYIIKSKVVVGVPETLDIEAELEKVEGKEWIEDKLMDLKLVVTFIKVRKPTVALAQQRKLITILEGIYKDSKLTGAYRVTLLDFATTIKPFLRTNYQDRLKTSVIDPLIVMGIKLPAITIPLDAELDDLLDKVREKRVAKEMLDVFEAVVKWAEGKTFTENEQEEIWYTIDKLRDEIGYVVTVEERKELHGRFRAVLENLIKLITEKKYKKRIQAIIDAIKKPVVTPPPAVVTKKVTPTKLITPARLRKKKLKLRPIPGSGGILGRRDARQAQ